MSDALSRVYTSYAVVRRPDSANAFTQIRASMTIQHPRFRISRASKGGQRSAYTSGCCRSVYTRHLRDHYGVDRHWCPRIRAPRRKMVCLYGVDLRSKYKPGLKPGLYFVRRSTQNLLRKRRYARNGGLYFCLGHRAYLRRHTQFYPITSEVGFPWDRPPCFGQETAALKCNNNGRRVNLRPKNT